MEMRRGISYLWVSTPLIPFKEQAMSEPSRIQDPETETAGRVSDLEKKVEELEIKSAFLEKELEEYKEASRSFYRKLNALEETVEKLDKEIPPSDLPPAEPSWDSENRDVHP
jgi:septal ring factor EnvC (AmiA/AmiB activator)